ncbi:MAG TPA: response regulator transcription factor [Candidatus Onthomonas avicola]|nr:response regulator transcription factor [Candidatus Onthomonas avicola]
MARILIVEDEEKLARMLELELTYEGYETEKALDGPTGLTMALSGRFDLVLLDIMLPGLSGMEVLRRLRREEQSYTPVLLLTARDAVTDKVSGLDAGAEDYITKPFAIEELLARIRVSLRKRSSGGQPQSTQLTVGEICLDPESRSVTLRGEPVSLTRREFDLLQHLMEHPNRVLTREQLLSQVWGYDYAGETNAVDVYISFLRNKLGAGVIDTVRGVGYIMRR